MVTQRSYEVATHQVRLRVMNAIGSLWHSLPAYRTAEIDRFIARAVPLVNAGQLQVANLTATYLRDQLGTFVPVDRDLVTGGRGVAAADVYRRPATAAYTALSKGESVSAAIAAGSKRLASLASMDMQMAKVRQAQRSLEGGGAGGFRRTLTGNENCAMCLIASTQRYNVGELLPIHPGCDCGVAPLPRGADLSQQVIDESLLEEVHAAVEDRTGVSDRGGRDPDYRHLVSVREHGEYGPTLTFTDQHFTSQADISAI